MEFFRNNYEAKHGTSVNFVNIGENAVSYRIIANEDHYNVECDTVYDNMKLHYLKKSLWYKILIIAIVVFAIVMVVFDEGKSLSNTVMYIFGGVWWLSIPFLLMLDKRRKTSYLLYDIIQQKKEQVEKFYDAFFNLANCEAVWLVKTVERHGDGRRNAGATSSIDRINTSINNAPIKKIQTNIFVPVISNDKRSYCFFPDKIVCLKKNLYVVDYADLDISVSTSQFRESRSIPSDSEKIGTSWLKVNNDGTPDKRFNENRKIPILKYCSITLSDKENFNLTIMVSNYEIGKTFANALNEYILHYKG